MRKGRSEWERGESIARIFLPISPYLCPKFQFRMIRPIAVATVLFLMLTSLTWGQELMVNPTSLSFSSTDETQTDSLQLVLENVGDEALQVKELRFFDTYEQPAFSSKTDSLTLPAGGSQSIWVYFHPRHNILHNSELMIVTDAPSGDARVDLQGQGTFSNSYYSTTQNLSQEALKSALKSRISQGYNSLGYTNARNEMFMDFDNQRVNGQGANVNTLECVYTGTLVTGYSSRTDAQNQGFNTEHTFPQGFFNQNEPMRSDLYHLYPTTVSSNSERGNLPFGTVTNPTWQVGGSKKGNGRFEPRDVHKGEVARAMFYFVIRYQDYSNHLAGQEGVLRLWHDAYPPTQVEQRRNDDISALQNNRNPFIDYPQFLERISSVSGNSVAAEIKEISISRSSTDLGEVPVGTSKAVRWVLVNEGNVDLSLSGLTLNSPELGFRGISGQDTTLGPGEGLEISVEFSPVSVGAFSGELTLTTDVPDMSTISLEILANATTDLPKERGANWEIFPNPVKESLWLRSQTSQPLRAQLLDLHGRLIADFATQTPQTEVQWNVTSLSKGAYWLLIDGQEGKLIWVE